MGIPISPLTREKWTDKSTGVTYLFRYLTGRYQDDFMGLSSLTAGKLPKSAGKSIAKGKKAEDVVLDLVKDDDTAAQALRYTRGLVDIFLAGWEGDNLPDFPATGKPSDYLTLADCNKLAAVIDDLSDKLCGLTVDDAKN